MEFLDLFPKEPGVVISNGRLLSIPWPEDPDQYPYISLYLAGIIEEQITTERCLVTDGYHIRGGINGTIVGDHCSFDTSSSDYPTNYIQDSIFRLIGDRSRRISICDYGGSTGGGIVKVLRGLGHTLGSDQYELTVTSLVTHDPETLAKNSPYIDHYYDETSAELPPEEFLEAFDLIVSIKGPLYWSRFPELVVDNFWKMLRPGGELVVAASRTGRHYDIEHGINVAGYLVESGHFEVVDIESWRAYDYMILKKNY